MKIGLRVWAKKSAQDYQKKSSNRLHIPSLGVIPFSHSLEQVPLQVQHVGGGATGTSTQSKL
jgi:hypothetical protein